MKTQDAIAHFGGIPELARALGIRRQAVHQWSDEVPRSRAFELEVLTQGALKAVDEEPDDASTTVSVAAG